MSDSGKKVNPRFLNELFDCEGKHWCAECHSPNNPGEPFCMKCGKPNVHFNLKDLKFEHGCESIEEARAENCAEYHSPQDPSQLDWKFCPFCGLDTVKLLLDSLE